jgi:hypothetical protein
MNKLPQRKNHKSMTNSQLEQKIMSKYTKDNPQPRTLEERVKQELNKLNK